MGIWDLFSSSKETEEEAAAKKVVYECDYETSCTPLFQAIENGSWTAVMDFKATGKWPDELFNTTVFSWADPIPPAQQAKTWVTSYKQVVGTDGEQTKRVVKWTRLPLHEAILAGAPYRVIEALLDLNPDSIKCSTNDLMLPLHLAFQCGVCDSVLHLMVDRYPDAIGKKNAKGLLPAQIIGCREELQEIIDVNVDYSQKVLDKQHLKAVEAGKVEMGKVIKQRQQLVERQQVITNESKRIMDEELEKVAALQTEIDEANKEVQAAKKELAYHKSKLQVALLQQDLIDARNEALSKLGEAAAAASSMANRQKEEEATIFTPREDSVTIVTTPRMEGKTTESSIKERGERKKMLFKFTGKATPL